MFTIDERIRGLPANREQVAVLHQSLNSPHLAIPGKRAGPAQAFIVGIRGANGFAVFIYLFLAEWVDCAVYVSDRRNLSADELIDEEGEAMGFVESMGFIMDNLNWGQLPVDAQAELLRSLPVFFKDPRMASSHGAAAKGEPAKGNTTAALGRLFASF